MNYVVERGINRYRKNIFTVIEKDDAYISINADEDITEYINDLILIKGVETIDYVGKYSFLLKKGKLFRMDDIIFAVHQYFCRKYNPCLRNIKIKYHYNAI
jgi:hypothetical protein